MKIQKPNIADYGLNEEDYDIYLEYINTLNKKKSFNLGICMLYIFSSLILFLCIKLGIELLLLGDLVFIDKVQLLGQMFGFSIGFFIFYVQHITFANKRIDKKAKIILENFSEKQKNMLLKYHTDYTDYDEKIIKIKQKLLSLRNELCEINSIVDKLKTIFGTINSEQLIQIIMLIIGKCSYCQDTPFDLLKDNVAIKCIGNGDFLSKIDLNDMIKSLHKNSYLKIDLYSLIELENYVNDYEEINVYNSDDITKLYNQYLTSKKEMIEKQIDMIEYENGDELASLSEI